MLKIKNDENNEKLRNLMDKNPKLPLVFWAEEKHSPLHEPYPFYQYSDCYIEEAYFDGDEIYPTLAYILDSYIDRLAERRKN